MPVKWGTTNALNEYDDAKGFVVNFGGVNAGLVPVTATNLSPTDFRAEVDSTFLLYRYYDSNQDIHVELMDIDGDGLPDRVMRQRNVSGTYDYFVTQRNTGSSFAPTNAWGPLHSAYGNTNSHWVSIRATDLNNNDTHLDFTDMNGDGFPDRVRRREVGSYTNWWVELNSGSPAIAGFAAEAIWQPVTNEDSSAIWRTIRSGQFVRVDLLDMNGDGLPDRVARKLSSPYDRFKVQLNTGMGFTQLYDWNKLDSEDSGPEWNSVQPVSDDLDTFVALQDINGDGLPDRIMRQLNGPFTKFLIQFNNGAGFELREDWIGLNSQGNGSHSGWNSPTGVDSDGDVHTALRDMNGDGLLDRVMRKASSQYTNLVVQLNTGSGFETNLAYWVNVNTLGESSDAYGSITGVAQGNTLIDLADINGDGSLDRVVLTNNTPYDKFVVQLNSGPFPDLLYEVKNGLGGKLSVNYTPSTQYDNRDKDWAAAGDPWKTNAVSKLGFPVWTVSSITVNSGMGGSYTTTYGYRGGFFDTVKREFHGFNRVEVTDPAGTRTVTYFHQGGGRDESANGEFADQSSIAKKGLPYRVEVWGDAGNTNLFRLTLNKVEEKLLHANGWYFPFVSQTIQMVYEGLGTGTYRATADGLLYDSNTGNVLISTNFGEVAGVNFSNHTFTTDVDTSDTVYTLTTYTNIGSIQNKPLAITVSKSGSGSPALRQSLFKYDGHGNLTESKAWLDTASDYVTNNIVTYDNVGNPTQTIDAAGITTTTTYDSTYRIFPVQTVTGTFTNQSSVDVLSGTVISTVEPNGMSTANILDAFFRSTETRVSTNSTSGPVLWRTRTDYTLLGAAGALSTNVVRKRVYEVNDTSNGIESYAYFDGLGRGVQTRAESETNGVFRVMDIVFDARGNPAFQTVPYFGSGSACAFPTGDHLGVYTEFDPIGRAFRATPAVKLSFDTSGQITNEEPVFTNGDTDSPVGSTTTYFSDGTNPWARDVVDAENKTSKSFFDGFGRVTNILNVVSSGNINTFFKYDPVGNLTNVTDNSGNITRIAYDSLGRKTSMTEPNMGTWTYAYDRAGRLTNQVDAKSQQIRFYFADAVGRMSKKEVYNASGNLTNVVVFGYDTNLSGFGAWKGAVTSVTDTNGWVRTGYDARGRANKTTRHLNKNATDYTAQSTYDEADQVRDITYPGSVTVVLRHFYTNGVLCAVKSVEGTGTSSETFYQLQSLNELGQATSYTTHSGAVTNTFAYYANSKRLLRMQSGRSGATNQSLTYKFDKVSNVKGVTDWAYSGACSGSFTNAQYDDLHRLTSLSQAGGARAYAYNALGNITTNSDFGAGLYQYTTSKPHAVTSANGKSYSYDNNGNMFFRGAQILSYDEENRLTQVDSNGVVTAFGYAEDGGRVWKQTPSGLQVWIGGLYEEKGGKTLCHVFAAGKRLATFEPSFGGPYVGVWAPKQIWAQTAETADAIATWPLREGRTPWTVLLLTLVLLLAVCLSVRQGWAWTATYRITRRFATLLPLLGERAGVSADRELETQNAKLETELAARERRWFTQPLWRQSLSALLIVALVFVTTPTDVQAQTYTPVFYYYEGDHLGSSDVMTDRSGTVVQHYEYNAFGSDKSCTITQAFQVSNRYTGQVLDEETGLYYYNARYYDPELGRFTQPDTMVPDPGDSQSLNRYAYVNNNPLKYTDPTGHDPATVIAIAVIVGIAVGAGAAAAQGANGQGIALAALAGGLGGLFGGVGAWAGGVVGAAAGSATAGAFVGAVAGGAVGGAVGSAITGGNIGMGALTGAIAGAIGFGVGQVGFQNPSGWEHLVNAGLSTAGGAAGGAIGAALQGGDAGMGAIYGAAAGFGGYWLTVGMVPSETLGTSLHGDYGYVEGEFSSGKTYQKKIYGGPEMVDWWSDIAASGDTIQRFKYVGHANYLALAMGKHPLLYSTGKDAIGLFYGVGGEHQGDGVFISTNKLIQRAFASNARISLCGCETAQGRTGSIAGGFKALLPGARVFGYTGTAWKWWPSYATSPRWYGLTGSRFVEVK